MNFPKVGDRIRIKKYATSVNGASAFVERVDGQEIYVRPRWARHGRQIQLYPNECAVERTK